MNVWVGGMLGLLVLFIPVVVGLAVLAVRPLLVARSRRYRQQLGALDGWDRLVQDYAASALEDR